MRVVRSIALSFGVMCVGIAPIGSAAQAQETVVGQVGAWRVLSRVENNAFNRCIGEMASPSGALRIAHNPRGDWAVSFPGFGGKGPLVGVARLNALSVQGEFTDHGGRASAPLSPQWINEFRRGGTLNINVAGRSLAWQMKDAAAVMRAVQDCVTRHRGQVTPGGAPGPVAVPAPGGPTGDPLAVVRQLYAPTNKARTKEPFSRRLAALHAAAVKRSQQLKSPVAGLDFDYAIDGQDSEPGTLASVRYRVVEQAAAKARVSATFNNGGARELHYDLVFEGGRWLIDDVRVVRTPSSDADSRWVLSNLYREGAK